MKQLWVSCTYIVLIIYWLINLVFVVFHFGLLWDVCLLLLLFSTLGISEAFVLVWLWKHATKNWLWCYYWLPRYYLWFLCLICCYYCYYSCFLFLYSVWACYLGTSFLAWILYFVFVIYLVFFLFCYITHEPKRNRLQVAS